MKPKPYNRRKRFLFELSRIQMLVSILGALFILVWVFILGIIVGRGYVSDTITRTFNDQIQKLQQEKKTLMEKYLAQGKKPDLPQDEILKPNNLDFYDDLSQKDKGGTQLKVPQPAVKPVEPQAKPESKASAQEIPKETLPSHPEAKSVKASEETKEAKEVKETKEPHKKTTGFLVLAGSYREEATAQSSVKRLHEKKYPALLKAKDIPQKGGKWFRVQIGPYENRTEAEKMIKKLEHDGFQAVLVENN